RMRAARAAAALAILAGAACAQQPARPPYLDQRSDEDWSFLRDHSRRSDIWDSWKFIPLGESAPNSYISVGGESRIRWDFFRQPPSGSVPTPPHGFFPQRYLSHADTHLGHHFRFFTQFQSGVETGRVGGPRLTDKDTAEIHQA